MSRGKGLAHNLLFQRFNLRHATAALPGQGQRSSIETAPLPEDGDDASLGHSASPDFLVPATEVAAIFGRTSRVLWDWEQRGILKPVRIRKRRSYWMSDIQALIDAGSDDA